MRAYRGGSRSAPTTLYGEPEVVQLHPMLASVSTSRVPLLPGGGAFSRGRGRSASCVRTAVFVFVVTFLWLQLHMANLGGGGSSGGKHSSAADQAAANAEAEAAAAQRDTSSTRSTLASHTVSSTNATAALSIHTTPSSAVSMSRSEGQSSTMTPTPTNSNATEPVFMAKFLAELPRHLHKYLLSGRNSSSSINTNSSGWADMALNISATRRAIEQWNRQQIVINEERFGPLLNDSLVIVVQVHTRVTYLRYLIISLAQARGIENVLLVISHDFYRPEINDLVRSIDFCKVVQIFYPFSIQTHPSEFPGESPGDCPRNMKRDQASKLKCLNAEHPDLYGHYREAKFTQTKHHWWWKANRVFDQLDVTRNHTGLVLFLEEDHYVAEDFMEVLRLMQRAARANCEQCNILSLGTYLKTYNYYGADAKAKEAARAKLAQQHFQQRPGANSNIPPSWNFQVLPTLYQHYQKAEVTPWVSSKHNMGMAFNRSVWREMRGCAEFFCTYDDYNWDWSLQHVSQGCMRHKLHALVMRGPRVFHIGECGVHHRKSNCESTAAIAKVQQVLRQARKHLFPSHLTLTFPAQHKKQKLRKGNGGWGDLRDHQLCLNMTLPQR